MEKSPYNFELIKDSEQIKIYSIYYRCRNVGKIELFADGSKNVVLNDGQNWKGSFFGDMWDFLFSKEPYNIK